MAGNSSRKGAIRKSNKKPSVGSGGQVRRGLAGKGPTPKATEREYHKAHKIAEAKKRAAAKKGGKKDSKTGGDKDDESSADESEAKADQVGAQIDDCDRHCPHMCRD